MIVFERAPPKLFISALDALFDNRHSVGFHPYAANELTAETAGRQGGNVTRASKGRRQFREENQFRIQPLSSTVLLAALFLAGLLDAQGDRFTHKKGGGNLYWTAGKQQSLPTLANINIGRNLGGVIN